MAHYEFNGTLSQCLASIDEYLGAKDLGCKTKIVIDIDNGKNESTERKNRGSKADHPGQ